MKKIKNGWVEGSVKEFLDLSDVDMEFIETRLALARRLRELRTKKHMTQPDLATRLHTSQSRVVKMEKGDPTVTIDLLIWSLYQLGVKRKEILKAS